MRGQRNLASRRPEAFAVANYPANPRPPCLHCERRLAAKGRRGLCLSCWHDRGIRKRYPMKPGGHGKGRDCTGARPLPEPTDAPPGSEAKVKVLARRARLRQELWHPEDKQVRERKSAR
jgi:hypothetical protein